VRKLVSVAVAIGLLAGLAGCSSDAKMPTSGCVPVKSGTASAAVKVTGKFGAEPTVKITTPVRKVKSTERTVVTEGRGRTATQGSIAKVDFAIYNGTTGKQLTTTGFDGKAVPFTVDPTKYLPGIVKTLKCSSVGSRVVGVIPPSDAYKSTGSTDLGIGAKDEMVLIADVISVSPPPAAPLPHAKGSTQAPQSGFPTVVMSAKGIPTVTIPTTAAPSNFMEEVLIKGKGATVGSDSNVVVNYQLLLWRTRSVVPGNDTYSAGQPASFNTGEIVPGFKQALEGQTVGSRIVFVVPPSLGYGVAGNSAAGIKGTDDIVFVADILGIS
jgi:peptidylprolyl isomerase